MSGNDGRRVALLVDQDEVSVYTTEERHPPPPQAPRDADPYDTAELGEKYSSVRSGLGAKPAATAGAAVAAREAEAAAFEREQVSAREVWRDLTRSARLLLILTLVLGVILIVFGLYTIVVGFYINLFTTFQEVAKTIGYALLQLVATAFLVYFAFDGVVNENPYETGAFILTSYLVLIRVGFQAVTGYLYPVVIRSGIEHSVSLGALTIAATVVSALTLALLVPLTILTHIVFRQFGFKMYRVVGSNRVLRESYRIYQMFLSFIKIDLQLGIMLIILSGFFIFRSAENYALWMNLLVIMFTVVWVILSNLAVRRENRKLVALCLAFSLIEPLYILYRVVDIYVDPCENRTVERPLFIVSGLLGITCRILVIVYFMRAVRNFGADGLRKHVFDRADVQRLLAKRAR